mmetsp:Transcript_96079/g.277482  ORF Transcript_96079/g.277482 Transcript_96079/m.277482 type:complete len:207 (-) Transcript_96079:220-840(-)
MAKVSAAAARPKAHTARKAVASLCDTAAAAKQLTMPTCVANSTECSKTRSSSSSSGLESASASLRRPPMCSVTTWIAVRASNFTRAARSSKLPEGLLAERIRSSCRMNSKWPAVSREDCVIIAVPLAMTAEGFAAASSAPTAPGNSDAGATGSSPSLRSASAWSPPMRRPASRSCRFLRFRGSRSSWSGSMCCAVRSCTWEAARPG